MKTKRFLILTTTVLLIIANAVENWLPLRIALAICGGALVYSIIKDIKSKNA